MSQDILNQILLSLGDIKQQLGTNTATITAILEQTKKTNGRVTNLEDYKLTIVKTLAELQKTTSMYSGILKANQDDLQRLKDKEIINADREKNELKRQNTDLKESLEKEEVEIKVINTEFKNKLIQWSIAITVAILIVTIFQIDIVELIKIIK